MQHLKKIYFMFQTKKKRKRLNFHHHTPLQQVHKNVTKQLCEILHDLQKIYFVIPYTQDIISLNGSTVSNQKYSTLSLCHQDICGLLTWHGTKIPTAKKRKSILIQLLEGIIFDTELQVRKKTIIGKIIGILIIYMHYVKFFLVLLTCTKMVLCSIFMSIKRKWDKTV